MLKIRVMPTLLYRDYGLVKGVSFDSWRHVGNAIQTIKVYNMREVDELVLLDISATKENRRPDLQNIDNLADECFMPMCVGGGIRAIEDVKDVLRAGADKVSVNTALIESPKIVNQIADRFGSQCVVASIDFKLHADGGYEVYTHSGTKPTGVDPVALAREVAKRGAGEILLTSIDRDGTFTGYDIELTRQVAQAVSIPVIASGGAGNYEHMAQAIREANASAVAAASIYHFTEQTPLEAKRYLAQQGFRIRL
jgi:imidazole glycerol-phosphate synthase subunit HisF